MKKKKIRKLFRKVLKQSTTAEKQINKISVWIYERKKYYEHYQEHQELFQERGNDRKERFLRHYPQSKTRICENEQG